jgi:hypothetical protein
VTHNDVIITSDTHTWRCRAVGFYRDEVPRACAFSGDGSLLAVGYDAIVTLWEPETNTLVCFLTNTWVHVVRAWWWPRVRRGRIWG